MIGLLIAAACVIFILVWIISTVNKLTRLKNLIRESWAQMDVVLKRRYDLIPNLVETCRAYAAHETGVFEQVANARAEALKGGADSESENAFVHSVNRLFATAEGYPELKSSHQFLELQRELANTEDRIAAARRFYNANVRDYNTTIEQFPSSLLAGDNVPARYFEVDGLTFRSAPAIRL